MAPFLLFRCAHIAAILFRATAAKIMGYVKHPTVALSLVKRKVHPARRFSQPSNLGKAAVLVHLIDKQMVKPAGPSKGDCTINSGAPLQSRSIK